MNVPMLEKYVDELVGVWFTLGEYENGRVDIEDQNRVIFIRMDKAVADKVVELQAEFRARLYEVLCKKEGV